MAGNNPQKYPEEALEVSATDDLLYTIWMIENAVEAGAHSPDISRLIGRVAGKLTPRYLEASSKLIAAGLETVVHLCRQRELLLEEEWFLIVTNLSNAFSLERYSKRIGRPVAFPLLQVAMDAVDELTHHFSDPRFRTILDAARGRYPNPFPPPL